MTPDSAIRALYDALLDEDAHNVITSAARDCRLALGYVADTTAKRSAAARERRAALIEALK